MHCHCGTNNRAPRWTFTETCRPEMRPGAREESPSPAWSRHQVLFIIFPFFIQPYLTRNWKTGSKVLSETPSFKKNGNRRYKYLVKGPEDTCFVKVHSGSKNKFSEADIINILEFLVDNIFVVFTGKVFQETVGIPMGTNCAHLLADIFLYSYHADFIHYLL